MFNLRSVKYSKRDFRNKRKIPEFMTEQLAELVGHHVGDGSLYLNKKSLEIVYSGSIEDLHYHQTFLKKAYKDLFNYDAKIKFPNEREVSTKVYSKAIATFFMNCIGLVLGSKKKMNEIPKAIMNSNKEIKCAFLRGFADADASLSFKKRSNKYSYSIININLDNEKIIKNISEILNAIEIRNNEMYNCKRYDKRIHKTLTSHYVQICGNENLEKWIKHIGFRNIKHLSKYLLFKKLGSCIIKTTLEYRMGLLGFPYLNILNPGPLVFLKPVKVKCIKAGHIRPAL